MCSTCRSSDPTWWRPRRPGQPGSPDWPPGYGPRPRSSFSVANSPDSSQARAGPPPRPERPGGPPRSIRPSTGRDHILRGMAKRDELPNERRANLELRSVIDEMLERVRDFRRLTGAWTREEREQAERELEAIMARVRAAATKTKE